MTETEWLNGWAYNRMYAVVRGRATTRQVRLYMAACCRLQTVAFFDPRILHAVEAAEWCADDPHAEATANAVDNELATNLRPRLPETGPDGELARAIAGVWQLLDACWGGVRYRDARHAIAHAAYLSLRSHPREIFTGGEGDAAFCCAWAIDRAGSLLSGAKQEKGEPEDQETETETGRAIAEVLRDIFGNPFRPLAVNTAWLTASVHSLARQMYESRDFSAMPILGDALEEAGYANADLLNHCRSNRLHVRGCWVIDMLTGRTAE